MTRLVFLLISFLAACGALCAQSEKGDTIVFQKQFFKGTKRLSAYCYRLKSTETGKATAWNRQGKVIFECEVSLRHGVHSAEFFFYEDGAVERVREHQAPDAGIQWYESTHFFDSSGNFLHTERNDWNETTTLKWTPETEQQVVVPAKPQEVVKEEPLHRYLLSLDNQTPFNLKVTAAWGGETQTTTILSGTIAHVLAYTNIGDCRSPNEHLKWNIEAVGRGKRKAKRVDWKVGAGEGMTMSGGECVFDYTVKAIMRP